MHIFKTEESVSVINEFTICFISRICSEFPNTPTKNLRKLVLTISTFSCFHHQI